MPEYDETITLESWPGETMHLLFPRYYRVLDEKGAVLLSASALWALVDQETRRMVFPDRHGVVIEGEVTGHEIALPSPAGGRARRRALHGALQLCGLERPHEQHPLLRPGGGHHPRRGGGEEALPDLRGVHRRGKTPARGLTLALGPGEGTGTIWRGGGAALCFRMELLYQE